ncbi:putative membrane protein YhdT [Virgibacillus natechei]|uniref:Membrane protein YhdT n=1 Tax=Virgibacillus natechei TaxID=1216297 RepID=A0ABS4IGP7_9BACI|nr:YhdT family protein [Virgibacillus natechei]MBP1970043.1 putative membrane protein YhdT [Virgibacillus natechei]UZD14128.1 YhdT family protein [Virgibacillus natechei]
MKNKREAQEPRFAVANREALIGCALAAFNIMWWYGFAYGLGSKPPEEYTYVLGFPAWFFYSCIVGFLVMVLLISLVVKFVLKDVSLEDVEEEDEVNSA